MPYSVDEKHSPSEFYYLGETNDPNATFQGENNAEQNSNKNSHEKVFSGNGLFYKFRKNCDSAKPYNKSLINLVCSVGLYGKVLPSDFIAQTSLLRRSVCTKTSGNTFPYRPRTRLISPYYCMQVNYNQPVIH